MTRPKGKTVTPAEASRACRNRQNALGADFRLKHAQRQKARYDHNLYVAITSDHIHLDDVKSHLGGGGG